MPLTFPTHIFTPANIRMTLQGRTIASPQSISGVGQVVRTDGGGFWVCEMSGIILNTDDKIRAWRAWMGEMEGGVVRVNVPIADTRLSPRPLHGKKLARPGNLHNGSDEAYFPEAVSYGAPLVIAMILPAAFRSTTVTINVSQGARLKGGEMFEIAHPNVGKRVYRVGRVLSRSGQSATVNISPPLRQAVAGGNVNFDWQAFEANIVSATESEPDLQYGKRAEVSITFREAF